MNTHDASQTTTPLRSNNSDADSGPLVRCEDVTHEYTRSPGGSHLLSWRRQESESVVTALRGVSIEITAGEVVGIAGPSGSGKSTLLHVLAGLRVPTAGTVELLGTDLTPLSQKRRTRLRREHVGFIFQRFHLLPSLSARANVALPLIQAGIPRHDRRQRAETLLERVGLGDRLTHTPGMLSGGEQQRVAIARALVTEPAVLLADEPTGELDTKTSTTVLDHMTELASKQAVLVASHDQTALDITDRILTMQDGRITTDAPR